MILHQKKTPHHKLTVVENETQRELLSGTGNCMQQSAIDTSDLRRHIYDHTLAAMYSLRFCPKPDDFLIVGLGGGIVPREMAHYFPEAKIDIVEIDPEIIEVAQKFFFLEKGPNIRTMAGDAFDVIKDIDKQYDIIVLDAFNSSYIPFHLMSQEFFTMVYERTREHGVVTVNACLTHPSLPNHIATISSVFGMNIYKMDGHFNDIALMLYVPKDLYFKSDLKKMPLPVEYYPDLDIKKIALTPAIKDAKIFSLKGFGAQVKLKISKTFNLNSV